SIMRSHYNKENITYPKTITNVNYLDIFLSILYYEELSVLKYGIGSSSFGATIGKLFLSEYAEDFTTLINEISKKNSSSLLNQIPPKKTKMKVNTLVDDISADFNLKKEECKKCQLCSKFLEMNVTDKIEDFIEKLSIFVYNN